MIYVARSSTRRLLPLPLIPPTLARSLSHSLSIDTFPVLILLLKLSKLVSVARVIYLRLNEIECRLNSPRPDNSHNFTSRQQTLPATYIYLHRFIYIARANRLLLAGKTEAGLVVFRSSEIIMPVDKSAKFCAGLCLLPRLSRFSVWS